VTEPNDPSAPNPTDRTGPAEPSAVRFTHGVASFDPDADRVILWTRVEGAERVDWHLVAASDGMGSASVRTGRLEVDDEHGCVSVDVDGLRPGTEYRYWFTVDGHSSPVGSTRTLPDGSPAQWRLALLCCADYSIHHLTVHRRIAEEPVDLVVHLGDYIYETDGKGERTLDPDRTCVTLGDYDRRYAQVRRDPATLALHAAHPMVAIWDDHDVADNAWSGGAKAHDTDEHGPWSERLRAAAIARQRWLPARLADPADPTRLWRSVRAGDLAELVLTDTRIAGRDQQAGDPGASPVDDPDRSLLGGPQRRWLEERIRDRSSRWCLLETQVVMSPMRLPVAADGTLLAGAPSGYGIVDGDAVCTDEWDGYPVERARVARWLADRGGDAVVISGDVHSAWVFGGAYAEGIRAVAPEFVCPGVSSTPLARQLPKGWRRLVDTVGDTLDGVRWSDLEHWGFTTLEVTPDAVTATWSTVDALDPDAPSQRSASWQVTHGSPGELRRLDVDPQDVAESVAAVAAEHRSGRRARALALGAAALVAAGVAIAVARRHARG
jgi:alkaline phosphatase D